MPKTALMLFLLAVPVGLGCLQESTARASDPQSRLPRDNLLVYRGPDDKPVPVKTTEDWAKRRSEVVRGMESVMGKLPGKEKECALNLRIEEEVDCPTYVRR